MLSLLEMSLYGGIFIIVIVILRAVAINRLPKAAFLVLWGAAFCRLVLPFSLPSPTSVYTATDRLGGVLRRPGVLLSQAAPAAGTALLPPATIVWIVGAMLCALFFLTTHLRSRRNYSASLPLEQPFVKEWLEVHRLRRPVQVRYSDQIEAPLTYGVLWPVILLPKSLDWSDREQLAFILAHELAHVRRFDALLKWLLAALFCLHWFNPMVWVMYVLANRDLELSCDEAVVKLYGQQARAPYALTLVELEEKRTHFAPLASSFSRNAMRERITAIMKSRRATVLSAAAALALVVCAVCVFATSAPAVRGETPPPAVLQDSNSTQLSGGRLAGLWEDFEPTGSTQEQYDLVVGTLKFDGYGTMSIAEFNRKINEIFSGDKEWGRQGINYAYEMVLMDLPDEDPNAAFLRNTVQASRNEYYTRLDEVYSGKQKDPEFSGSASYYQEANVFGNMVRTGYVQADYSFTYRILDQDRLTVDERDGFLQRVMQGAYDSLGSALGDAADGKDAERRLQAALEKAGKEASTERIAFTGCTIDYLEPY